MNNNEWGMLRKCLVALNDNTNHLFDIMDKQEKIFDDVLKLLEEVIMDEMYLDALSVYRNLISDFVEEIKGKLDPQVWCEARNAIRRKRKNMKRILSKRK
jgi:hypothetical protein